MADIKHLKADASQEDIFSVIDQDAALILDDVLDNDLLNQIKDELDPYLNNYIKGKTEFTGFETKSCLLYTSPSPRDLSTSRMPSSA